MRLSLFFFCFLTLNLPVHLAKLTQSDYESSLQGSYNVQFVLKLCCGGVNSTVLYVNFESCCSV